VLINHSTILLSTLQAINYYLFHKKWIPLMISTLKGIALTVHIN
jgi:hypothetical protein